VHPTLAATRARASFIADVVAALLTGQPIPTTTPARTTSAAVTTPTTTTTTTTTPTTTTAAGSPDTDE
jgi:hypothetical protein